MSAPGTPYIPGTPFIPPLTSANNSPNPEPAPVIPGPNGTLYPQTSPLTNNYPFLGAGGYPQYQSSPYSNNSPFIPPSPNAPYAPVIPPQPVSRGHSRQGSRQGLSADFTGYPQGNPYTPAVNSPQHIPPPQAQPPPVQPPPLQHQPYHYSPYHQPTSAPPLYGGFTPWGNPQPSLSTPYGPASARGLPPQGYGPPPMGAYQTPGWMPGALPGGPPAWGGTPQGQYYPQLQDPNAGWYNNHPAQNQRAPPEPPSQVYDRMDPFTPGMHYHPVLEPFLVKVVNAKVRVNPLISVLPEDGADQVHLNWNMLFPTSNVHRSDTPRHLSWSAGRDDPATYPRVTSIRLVSESIPWMIDVRAKDKERGITCGEVIEAIGYDMGKLSNKHDFENLSPRERVELTTAYRMNRSRNEGVPGGQLGEGMKRLDFLRKNTMFAGIENNDRVVARLCGDVMPCVFVLKCSRAYPMTKQEIKDNELRARTATHGTRSRANSNATSSRITVEAPSTTDSDNDDEYDR